MLVAVEGVDQAIVRADWLRARVADPWMQDLGDLVLAPRMVGRDPRLAEQALRLPLEDLIGPRLLDRVTPSAGYARRLHGVSVGEDLPTVGEFGGEPGLELFRGESLCCHCPHGGLLETEASTRSHSESVPEFPKIFWEIF